MATIKISELTSLTTVLGNVEIPLVANVAGTLTTVKGNVTQLTNYVLGSSGMDYANLVANAGAQAGSIASLTSNAAVQAGLIATLQGNVATIEADIVTLTANAASQAGVLATLTANAASQAGDLATLTANAGAQSGDLATLTSNAAVQAGILTTLTSNAASQAGELATLTSNAAVQAGELATLTSNAAVQAGEIATLLANAGSQSGAISTLQGNVITLSSDVANLLANAGAQSGSISSLTANAAVQAGLIAGLEANVAILGDASGIEANIDALFSAVGTHTGQIADLESNAAVQAGQIATLTANAAVQAGLIGSLGNISGVESNIAILQSNVSTIEANITGIIATGISLVANDVIHSSNISTLQANVTTLFSNAAVQAGNIATLTTDLATVTTSVTTANTAMKGYVDAKITANITALVGGAPSTLDTLNELATALGSDANLSVTLTNSIANVAANVATLTSNAAVQAGNIAVLQSAVGSLTSNAATQQTAITNITNGTATFGNLIPSANVTYSLGNVTHQWKEMYVSSSTVYIGGVPLSTDAGKLTVGGLGVSDKATTITTPPGDYWSVANVKVPVTGFVEIRTVTYGGGKFVVVDNGADGGHWSNSGAYSTDGTNWTRVSLTPYYNQALLTMGYGAGKFVGAYNGTRDVTTSPDGITWTLHSNAIPASSYLYPHQYDDNCLAYGGGRFVLLDRTNALTYISTDGVTWANGSVGGGAVGSLPQIHPITGQNLDYVGIKFGSGRFITWGGLLSGGASNLIAYSSDGVTWDNVSLSGGYAVPFRFATDNNGTWVGLPNTHGHDNVALRSTDNGSTWSNVSLISSNSGYYPVYADGRFVAVPYSISGGLGNIIVSTDGSSWSNSATLLSSIPNNLDTNGFFDIAYGGGVIVAVGDSNDSSNVALVSKTTLASTSIPDLTVTGNIVIEGNLTVSPTSIHMGNLTMSAPDGNLTVNTGIAFTMANFQHWTSNVSTISDALNQLAERIYNIENP